MSTLNPVTDYAQRVKLLPNSKRARDRINEHGEVFALMKEGTFKGEKAVLLHSLKRGWMGWFTHKEASWEIVSF